VRGDGTALPWHVVAVALAATSATVGLIWDVSWHRSIGRDTFWTPAHLALYLSGILGGGAGGWLVLKSTVAGAADAPTATPLWGLRGPLGAWTCVWGALAMLTSAPFDNWWHNAYGLDVKVLSPPHVLLGVGLKAINTGALLLVAALQNGTRTTPHRRLVWAYVYLAGMLVGSTTVDGVELTGLPNRWHNATFYEVAAASFPTVLVATARSARIPWSATLAAACYMGITLIMTWSLPLFPATPRLAPVYHPITHMVAAPFPLMLVAPARGARPPGASVRPGPGRAASAVGSVVFVALMLAAHWPFGAFLLSPYARNPLFGADQWGYSEVVNASRHEFWGVDTDPVTLPALGLSAVIAAAAIRIGLWLGDWVARVKR